MYEYYCVPRQRDVMGWRVSNTPIYRSKVLASLVTVAGDYKEEMGKEMKMQVKGNKEAGDKSSFREQIR